MFQNVEQLGTDRQKSPALRERGASIRASGRVRVHVSRRRKNFAMGSPTNQDLRFGGHLLSPKFRLF